MHIVVYDAENLSNEISLPLSQLLASVIRDDGSMGWTLIGNVPNYATGPDGSFHSVSFYHKELIAKG